MVWWWWILPGVLALIGALTFFGGLGTLFRGRLFGALPGVVFGGAFLAGAAIIALLGMNLQTYNRLAYERPVATVDVVQQGPQLYGVTVTQPPTEANTAGSRETYALHGDEWRLEAQVLKWKPWANVLGLDSQYRLDRLSGRYQNTQQEISGIRSVHDLNGGDTAAREPWEIDAWEMARLYGRRVGAVDTLYGGATYMPMAQGARYEVWITQSGLIARPVNNEARQASSGGWSVVR